MSLSLCRKRRPTTPPPQTPVNCISDHAEENDKTTASKNKAKRSRRNNDSTPETSLPSTSSAALSSSTVALTKRISIPRTQQVVLSQSQLRAEVSPQRCGKILRMHLTNFMCHSNLSIDFHSRINFLVGSNGSGKSAVLAAIILGLGANARATNRSDRLKQLIKTGESSAKIEITMDNQGPEAYESNIYGDRITIVRNITQSSATYTIKNAQGHVISRKNDDLQRMLMYHNVQVDNPVFVLNQDSAREFLKESDPKKNYKLFLKATQIEMVMEKLNDCLFAHKDQEQRLEMFEKQLENKKAEIKELKQKLHQLLSMKKLKDIVVNLEVERVWLIVSKHENDLNELLQRVDKIAEERKTLQPLVESRNDVEIELTQKISNFDTDIKEKSSAYSSENTKYQNVRNILIDLNSHYMKVSTDIESVKNRISSLKQQTEELKNHIESKNNLGDIAVIRQRNEIELNNLRRANEDNCAIIESAKRDLKIFVDDKLQTEEQMRDVKHKKLNFDENIRRLDAQISQIKSSSKNALSIYGQHVPELLAEIDKLYKMGKFSELPRGPIGRYIEVPNERYRNVVEYNLGRMLQGFVVSTTKDRLTLTTLLKQKFPSYQPTIITTKFLKQVYDVRRGRVNPSRGTCLLMDVIKCNDPIVMNCLIDRCQIESILLADTQEIAEHMTSHRENVPQNLHKVIVSQYGLEYYPEPNYRMYSIQIRPANYIQVNIRERIRQLQTEQNDLKNSLQSLDAELMEFQPKLKSNYKHIGEKRALLERHEEKKRELQEKIRELENYEYPDFNEVDILKNELVEYERRLELLERKYKDKETELQDASSKKEIVEHKIDKQKQKMQSIQREIDEIRNNHENIKMELRSVQNNFQFNQNKLQKLDEKLLEIEHEKSCKQRELNKALKEAQKKGERIQSDRNETEILDEIQKIKAKLKNREKMNDSPEDLQILIEAKEHTIEIERSNYQNIKISVSALKKSIWIRLDFVTKLKKHMVMVLNYSFGCILKIRNYEGCVTVDHDAKTLTVSVKPHIRQTENAVDSTKALSGGERSFSTVAFLISLWSCVDHPFYFLDEYDVFTDEVNREYMTRLLINEGQQRPNRQYTFLTPQDLSIAATDFMHIHRLAEPDRR